MPRSGGRAVRVRRHLWLGHSGRRAGAGVIRPTAGFDTLAAPRYRLGMKTNTKSSITLPPEELKLVTDLQAKLKAKSKVEVVRRGLRLLQETTDRQLMREAYRKASVATRRSWASESEELEDLISDGLHEK